jgi:hypothetical protein
VGRVRCCSGCCRVSAAPLFALCFKKEGPVARARAPTQHTTRRARRRARVPRPPPSSARSGRAHTCAHAPALARRSAYLLRQRLCSVSATRLSGAQPHS